MVKPRIPLFVCLLLTLSFGTADLLAQAGGSVIPIKRREKILTEGRTYIFQKDPELQASFAELTYPFAFKEEEKMPEPVAVKPDTPKEPELTDREVLEAIAPKITATGTLERGGQMYLIFPNGQLPDGGTIRLNFRGKPYIIRVNNVSSAGYSLELNEEVVRKRFGEDSTGTIERTNPNAPK